MLVLPRGRRRGGPVLCFCFCFCFFFVSLLRWRCVDGPSSRDDESRLQSSRDGVIWIAEPLSLNGGGAASKTEIRSMAIVSSAS